MSAQLDFLERVDVLATVQCVVAHFATRAPAHVEWLLHNHTEHANITYEGAAADLIEPLLAQLRTLLPQAVAKIILDIRIKAGVLVLVLSCDEQAGLEILLPNTCVLDRPLVEEAEAVDVKSKAVTLVVCSDDIYLQRQVCALESRLNIRCVVEYDCNVPATLKPDQLRLVDQREQNNLSPGGDKSEIVVYLLTALLASKPVAETTQSPSENSLFWPFFDTDLQLLLMHMRAPMITQENPQSLASTEIESFDLSILVADDSLPSQIATRVMLEQLGCEVTCANDGERALQLAQEAAFDVLLLDERMPGLLGSEVASILHSGDSANRNTPKISLTGLTEPDAISALFAAGITHYLEKPVSKAALKSVLTQLRSITE
jgi:CheY-like chemotaxis protein